MKFADFHVGQVIVAGPRLVTQEEICAFAKDYDPQWFHTDPQEAGESRFGGLIASGWHTCGVAMRMVVDTALRGSESYASPGLAYVRWPRPVRPGDLLRLRATVLDVRLSSRAGSGILRWRWQLFNGDDQEVLDLEATSLFDIGRTVPGPAGGDRAA